MSEEIKYLKRFNEGDNITITCDFISNVESLENQIKQQYNTMYAQLKDEYEEEIKDLQQENERLKEALNCKEYFSSTMPEDTEFVILTKNNYDRQQKDIQLELIDYKFRCEKAIEYIENQTSLFDKCYFSGFKDLLNILQNGSDSQ